MMNANYYRSELERIEAELVEVTLRLDELLEDVRDVLRPPAGADPTVIFRTEDIEITKAEPVFEFSIAGPRFHPSLIALDVDFWLPAEMPEGAASLFWLFDTEAGWPETFAYYVYANGRLISNPRLGKGRTEGRDWARPLAPGPHHLRHEILPGQHVVLLDGERISTSHSASHIDISNGLTIWLGVHDNGREVPPVGMVVNEVVVEVEP